MQNKMASIGFTALIKLIFLIAVSKPEETKGTADQFNLHTH